MSSFAALMALSATQTRQSEAAVQNALELRHQKEAERRKRQEEKDKKDREMEAKLRKKLFEDEKRHQERMKKLEEERAAKERETERREEEQRNALRYGPNASKGTKSGYPSSSYSKDKKGGGKSLSDDDDSGGGNALTREEKRQRRLESSMGFRSRATKRYPQTSGYRKAGRKLPGGAIDSISSTGDANASNGNYRSVRERLAAEPASLIKLNVNKRDTRTIDEILQDRAKAKESKVLEGEEAREFADWFGKSKGKAKADSKADSRGSSIFSSRASSLEQDTRAEGKTTGKSTNSTRTPASATPPATQPKPFISSKPSMASLSFTKTSSAASIKGSGISVKAVSKQATPANGASRLSVTSRPPLKSTPSSSRLPPSSRPSMSGPKTSTSTPSLSMKKRPREPSLSPTPPPPPKRRLTDAGGTDLSAEIWKMFGKDRDSYVARDVMSDDEDMEVNASMLEREELYSSRVARKEEELAVEAERRHEEEKRRKRKERDARERRAA